MQKSCFFALSTLLFSAVFQSIVLASSFDMDEHYQSLYSRSAELKHSGAYAEAILVAQQITKMYPGDPAGFLALIAAYRTLMDDFRITTYQTTMDSLIELTVELAEQQAQKDKRNPQNHFYLGTSYASRALSRARRGDLLAAVRDGLMVKRSYRRALSYGPELYDAYYGLGQFNYWSSVFSKMARLINDQRDAGIAQLKLASNKGRFLSTDALYGLLAIYFHEQNFQEAKRKADILAPRYPTNPGLLFKSGRISQHLGDWQAAATAFANLYDILLNTEYQSPAFQMDCLLQMAKCSIELGDYEQASGFSEQSAVIAARCDLSKESYNYSGLNDELQNLINQLQAIDRARLLATFKETDD